MNLSNWFAQLLPQQREFFENRRGASLHDVLKNQGLEFEYTTEHGFFAYVNGEFYIHEEDTDWEAYAKELEVNGTERVVLLDWYGDVLYQTPEKLPEGVVDHSRRCWTVWLDQKQWTDIALIPEIESCLYSKESNKTTMALSVDSLQEEFETTDNEVLKWILAYLKNHKDIWEVRLEVW